ncbi:MAG: GNAT family N-acetyltransferase [candidate division Zixibacteria bacterium]|nr:GNAT family N-acetyltransferase [candidate division Zixibacteria bacterium]NIR63464.1 GNAT family N-acetyltransferase [candidate division Zixibacteria bacterium]NIS16178.1 GNAT family N-acetyltransferase [candidate division Zixibacteria bacterium]NIS45419.1 GNAT family N-acetyltransferase [candidate division Zixibacteria bacterium]NIT53964.1 GNAT family N-acetyltransferase [candidate division Zixibacteria bacterium]
MAAISLNDKSELHSYFSQNKWLYIYNIGDLDDFFWPYTKWYGLKDGSNLQAVILLYTGLAQPTLLALSDNIDPLRELLSDIRSELPDKFYAHLSPGVIDVLKASHSIAPHGRHYKMGLVDRTKLGGIKNVYIKQFDESDLGGLRLFYYQAYPGNWFSARMLKTGHYYGVIRNGRIASVAGVHVYSKEYKVAALGNIATHPDYRGNGFGRVVTAECCRRLLRTVDTIGLNVSIENKFAINIYENLGFEKMAEYEEYVITK